MAILGITTELKGTSIPFPSQSQLITSLLSYTTLTLRSQQLITTPCWPAGVSAPCRSLPRAAMSRFPLAATGSAALALLLLLLLPLATAAGTAAKAKAPAAPPAPPNITALMFKGGCKAFASLVSKSPDALSAFQSAVGGGVTAFCPTDDAVGNFMPSYRNLTADGKASLLLFHAVPVYYTLRGLKSSNGPMNTLATDGAASNYNLTVQNAVDQVTLRTPASDDPVRVRSTVYDRDPVAIYAVDAVLEPVELFDPAEAPAPAPAPVADAPRASSSSGKRTRHQRPHGADAPGPAADDASPADQRKDSKKNAAAHGVPSRPRWLAAVAVAVAASLAA